MPSDSRAVPLLLVGAAQADAATGSAASTRVVQLERVVIVAPRTAVKA